MSSASKQRDRFKFGFTVGPRGGKIARTKQEAITLKRVQAGYKAAATRRAREAALPKEQRAKLLTKRRERGQINFGQARTVHSDWKSRIFTTREDAERYIDALPGERRLWVVAKGKVNVPYANEDIQEEQYRTVQDNIFRFAWRGFNERRLNAFSSVTQWQVNTK